jgi:hypothetical protein
MSIWDYSPAKVLYDSGRKAMRGDFSGAADDLGRYTLPYQGAKAGYAKGQELYGDAKDAINAPYEKSREGFDVILGRLGELKQERLRRKDDLYGRANAQYDDTRNAMSQVYGDPRMWRL